MRGAPPQFFAYGAAHRIRAVGNRRERIYVAHAAALAGMWQGVIAGPEVAMAAGLADGPPSVEEPRHAFEQPVFQRGGQAYIATSGIAQSREAAVQAGTHEARREMRQVRHGGLRDAREVQARGVDMHVRVDQTGHEHAARAIHCLRQFVGVQGSWGDAADQTAVDQHIVAFPQNLGITVEYARIAEQSWHVGSLS